MWYNVIKIKQTTQTERFKFLEEENKMKLKNVKFSAVAYYSDGTSSKLRFFCTERAMSKWANAQYDKDEDVTVQVYVGLTDELYCTYHA